MTVLLLTTGLFADDDLLGDTLSAVTALPPIDIGDPDQEDSFWDGVIQAIVDSEKVITL